MSFRIKSPVPSAEGWKIAKRAGMLFLNERRRLANCCLRELEKEKKDLELNLGRMINVGEDYDMVRRISQESAKRVFEKTREKQKGKFNRLLNSVVKKCRGPVDRSKWIVNLSSRTLTQEEEEVLKKRYEVCSVSK